LGVYAKGPVNTPTLEGILGVNPGRAEREMALTDVAIRNAKPGEKAIKLADGAGMFLLVD